MSPRRVKERWGDFQNALKRLDEVLKEDLTKSSAIIDGAIQRFEFTFELSWKLMRDVLVFKGIAASSPRDTIKEAFQQGMIKDGNGWIQMLEDRNRSSHVYDEKIIRDIYNELKSVYYRLFVDLNNFLEDEISRLN